MLERLYALEQFGIKLGLANIQSICEALGHPERACASLHVAGTNGKGSVTAMAHAALRASGVRAARYTSPHLVHLHERFVIGDAPVSDADLGQVANEVLDLADRLVARGVLAGPPTFFEATTAIAFELFRRGGVEVAVFEVGLGGRFDATNVVTPIAAAITSIGLDHQQHLGDTIEQIAREKAGIIKPGVAVVAGALPDAAWPAVLEAAAQGGSQVARAIDECVVVSRVDDERPTIEVRTPQHHYRPVTLALRGEHQIQNALVAVRLLEYARGGGVPVSFEGIEQGLSRAGWPGRLEVLAFEGGRELLLDAAHNGEGAASLAHFLARYRRERPPLVFAAMRDKDLAAILRPLLPRVGPIVVTAAPSHRASTPDELVVAVRGLDPTRSVIVEPNPVRAVNRAWVTAPRVCVAGSIFLVGAVRGALQHRAIVDSSP